MGDRKAGVILYEYPLNERMRIFLRLESLFKRLMQLLDGDSIMAHHYALITFYEVIDMGNRIDVRGDLIRDLEKQKQTLNTLKGNPAIAADVLESHLTLIETCFRALSNHCGRMGQVVANNTWLSHISSRLTIPTSGCCSFDVPSYHQWQAESVDFRKAKLTEWVQTLQPFFQALNLVLRMIRETAIARRVLAVNGVYQQNFSSQKTHQLLRVLIPEDQKSFPETCANRMCVSIRMMKTDYGSTPQASQEDCTMEIMLCS